MLRLMWGELLHIAVETPVAQAKWILHCVLVVDATNLVEFGCLESSVVKTKRQIVQLTVVDISRLVGCQFGKMPGT